MQKSLIKFDDLAFILLFFFMVIAVVSFGQSAQSVKTAGERQEAVEAVSVFLESDGSLVMNGRTVDPSSFDASACIELSCSPDVQWSVVQSVVNSLACEVVLVV